MSAAIRKRISRILNLSLAVTLSSCAFSSPMDLDALSIEHETEFGGAYLHITIDEFLDLGYQFGDSVNVEFSNGSVMEDLPFYDGYYVPKGEPLLIGYPGYPYIKAVNNSDDDIWELYDLDESDTAYVSLNEKGKYLETQKQRSLGQITDRDAFDSDEVFANFRALSAGNLKENLLYRSSSPIDDTYGRASYTDDLCEKYGIRYILNLSDSEEKLEEHLETDGADSDYYRQLYEAGNVLMPELSIGYETPEIKTKIASALKTMCEHEGPYLLHCSLGKDRSGFVSLLLEMLAGASYEEMLEDYMKTYESFYRITEQSDPDRYELIRNEYFSVLLYDIITDESADLHHDNLIPYAENYLREGGMSENEIKILEETILK